MTGRAARDIGVPPARRSLTSLLLLCLAAFLVFAVLVGLGTWQVHRLAWKRDLIARVAARVDAAPTPAPAPDDWEALTGPKDEYRHVRAKGRFITGHDTKVQAVTDYGGGFWIMSPFRTDAGFLVLVNRGFVPPDTSAYKTDSPPAEIIVTGLLRISEPKGAFLRKNDPDNARWYSRDVAAIAASDGLGPVAPYFIDAAASPDPSRYPIGGLTVIAFSNDHLVYAATWYGLAAMLAVAIAWLARDEWRMRRRDR